MVCRTMSQWRASGDLPMRVMPMVRAPAFVRQPVASTVSRVLPECEIGDDRGAAESVMAALTAWMCESLTTLTSQPSCSRR